jgi:hypothetical protein
MHRLKTWYMTEKSKLSTLTGKEKVSYIWEYYKLFIIFIVCACAFLFYMASLFGRDLKDYRLYVTMVATNADVGNDSALHEGFISYAGFDEKTEPVYFDNECYFDYSKNNAVGNTYYERLVTYIEAGVQDAVIMETDDLVSFGESGRLIDLESESCEAIREKYGEYFIYCTPSDEEYAEGGQVAVGIDISESVLMKKYQIYDDSCALGIGEYTKNVDAVEMFLDYIFEEADDGQ